MRHFNVELIAFEDRADDGVRVRVNDDYLDTVSMPRSAYEADKIVYLPCMKTHNIAGFCGALEENEEVFRMTREPVSLPLGATPRGFEPLIYAVTGRHVCPLHHGAILVQC